MFSSAIGKNVLRTQRLVRAIRVRAIEVTLYTENFTSKNWKFSDKKFWYFSYFCSSQGGSNEYPQSMFLSRNKKNNVYPCKPQFCYIKMGFKGGQNYIGVFSWWLSMSRCTLSWNFNENPQWGLGRSVIFKSSEMILNKIWISSTVAIAIKIKYFETTPFFIYCGNFLFYFRILQIIWWLIKYQSH